MLEVLLALAIVAALSAFAVTMSHSTRNAALEGEALGRLETVAALAVTRYRHGGRLPTALSEMRLPTAQTVDPWGQALEYRVDPGGTDGFCFTVNDRAGLAGVVMSFGPNQTQDSVLATALKPDDTITLAGDDLLVPIDVGAAAVEIAVDRLTVLRDKVRALDALYAGVNNNPAARDGANLVDESGCVAMSRKAAGCPPMPTGDCNNPLTVPTDPNCDPNCAVATLDSIESGTNYGCAPSGYALEAVIAIFGLGDECLTDPWGKYYAWGCAEGCPVTYPPSDPRYHLFFSSGPDRILGTDDDILP